MRLRIPLQARWRRALLGAAIASAGLGAAGCQNDVDVTDPNAPSSATFWQSAADADAGVTATYNTLLRLGTFQRWQAFAYDARADIGTTGTSPWAELAAFGRFEFPSGYDFEVNRELWNHNYELVSRANQVIANVPAIDMEAARRDRIVGEGRFLRGLGYFRLMTLYGGQIPLVTAPPVATDRPESADSARVWAQIEQDFTAAAAALPRQLMSASGGRATAGAAQGMLGKTLLQQRKWAQASAALAPIIAGQYGSYQLASNYATLFRQEGNNGPESLFEVQMGNVDLCGQGLCGLNIAKMSGACGPGYCDGRPTRWYFTQFLTERTASGAIDPRLDATIFYYRGDTTRVYGRTWRGWRDSTDQRGNYTDTTRVYWKKYGEYYTGSTDQTWEAQINYKVLRYADVLLMQAEALNEQGQPAAALPLVNQVRQRVGLASLAAGLSQAAMRDAILRERLLEFGLEGQRWLDLGRQNLFADLAALRARDPDFNSFTAGKSQLLPITQRERNLNPNVRQNPGW
ncbi:MAG: RagB/SusD family nutrient uptake outer membrane protein [Gemmatirosa sp.]